MLKYFKHKKAIMKKVLYVLHQKTSVAGDVGNKFKNRGFSADIIRPPLGDILPTDLTLYSAIVIFGGPMSVNDDEQFIRDEINWMKQIIESNIPFLGICLGLQCAVIEFARNVCGLDNANSTEFNKKTKYPVIDLMESQRAIKLKGGTMRLGAYDCELESGSKAQKAYGRKKISERHRHRWEVNNRYRDRLEKNGLRISGINSELNLVEIVELKNHPWYIAAQFHPELKSRVSKAHPLFRDFIKASVKQLSGK